LGLSLLYYRDFFHVVGSLYLYYGVTLLYCKVTLVCYGGTLLSCGCHSYTFKAIM
jgi:hypothetical protein